MGVRGMRTALAKRHLAALLRARASTRLAAGWRTHAARKRLVALRTRRDAAITMQRILRGTNARMELGSRHAAATTIAKFVRGHSSLISFALSLLAVIELQRIARGSFGRRIAR